MKSKRSETHAARGDLHRVDLQQKLDHRSDKRQRDEGGQKGAQPEIADQQAVDQPDERPHADRRDDGRLGRPLGDVDQRQNGEIGQREVGADAEIDAAGQHDDRHADDDQSEFADLPRRVDDAAERQKIRNRRSHIGGDRDEKKDGDRVVDPLSAKQLADDMIGYVSVAQPGGQLGNHRDVFQCTKRSAETVLPLSASVGRREGYFSRFFTLQHRPGRSVSLVILVVGL